MLPKFTEMVGQMLHTGNKSWQPSCGIGRPTVAEYLRRAQEAGVSWPLPADLDDTRLGGSAWGLGLGTRLGDST